MKHQTKAILGGFMGNVVEAYDVSLCYVLSKQLSRYLIGDANGSPTVILTLVFIAYLAKPIGAFILGLFSDLYGRKKVLLYSIVIMGLSTSLMGLIPDYQSSGMLAASLLLMLRIIQSMALGAEFFNSASLLVESGQESRRGFRGCWSSVGVKAGYLLACIVIELNDSLLSSYVDAQWLWRIPFLLAVFTTLIGILIRYRMPESLGYVLYYADKPKPTTQSIYQTTAKLVKLSPFLFNYAFFASFLSVATGFFFYLYIPLHAGQYSSLSHPFIQHSTIISLAVVTVLIPVFGYLSDSMDRLKMLTFATSGLLLFAYPFMHTINYGNETSFLIMQILISIFCAAYYSVSTVLLTELFPLPVRCTALSIVFSIAASLASGVPPLLADLLTRMTHNPDSPALIMFSLSFIVLVNIRILTVRYRVDRNSYIPEFVHNARL